MEKNLEGFKEINDALEALPVLLQGKILRGVNLKAVNKFVVEPLRGTLPYKAKTEANIRAIPEKDDPTAVLGGPTNKAFWLRFADLGTAEREGNRGNPKGRIVGKHQIEGIILNSMDNIVGYMQTELGDEVKKDLEKRLKATTKKL